MKLLRILSLALFVLVSALHSARAADKTFIAAANVQISLIEGLEELQDESEGASKHALFTGAERIMIFRIEEQRRSFADTLTFVREAYVPTASLVIDRSEELTISGCSAVILYSGAKDADPDMRQIILVMGDGSGSVFAYVAYETEDESAPADAKHMFQSIVWPVNKAR